MKIFRIVTVVLFALAAGAYGFFYFYGRAHTDLTYPVISYASEVLEVPVDATEADLLRGVAAYDGKDGDLTNRIMVEKISNFIEKGVSNITYAVADLDDHVVKTTRRVRYIGYESPRFTFSRAMRFPLGTAFNVMEVIGARDMIDGDVTGRIKLTSSDLSASTEGVYRLQAQVTNSRGDVSYLSFYVTMYRAGRNDPEIVLTDYLVYLHVGDAFSPDPYVKEITRNEEVLTGLSVRTDSDVDTKKAGNYQADYYVIDENGAEAVTSLVVIVEE